MDIFPKKVKEAADKQARETKFQEANSNENEWSSVGPDQLEQAMSLALAGYATREERGKLAAAFLAVPNKALFTAEETYELLDLSRSKLTDLEKSKALVPGRIGTSIRYSRWAIINYIANNF